MHHLTQQGFYWLQSKIQLEISHEMNLIAKDDVGRIFDYGQHGWDVQNTGQSAREWLGI
ncbi:hypothetical protein D3C81_1192780 [compost metagenome]